MKTCVIVNHLLWWGFEALHLYLPGQTTTSFQGLASRIPEDHLPEQPHSLLGRSVSLPSRRLGEKGCKVYLPDRP